MLLLAIIIVLLGCAYLCVLSHRMWGSLPLVCGFSELSFRKSGSSENYSLGEDCSEMSILLSAKFTVKQLRIYALDFDSMIFLIVWVIARGNGLCLS